MSIGRNPDTRVLCFRIHQRVKGLYLENVVDTVAKLLGVWQMQSKFCWSDEATLRYDTWS